MNCNKLLRIELPAFVEKIGQYTFSQASALGFANSDQNSVLASIDDFVRKIWICDVSYVSYTFS